jgi:hypothetical protein
MNWMRETTPEYRNAWLKTRQEKSIQYLRNKGREWNNIDMYLKEMKDAAPPDNSTIKNMKENRHAYHNKVARESRERRNKQAAEYQKRAREEDAQREKKDKERLNKKARKQERIVKIKATGSSMCCIL